MKARSQKGEQTGEEQTGVQFADQIFVKTSAVRISAYTLTPPLLEPSIFGLTCGVNKLGRWTCDDEVWRLNLSLKKRQKKTMLDN